MPSTENQNHDSSAGVSTPSALRQVCATLGYRGDAGLTIKEIVQKHPDLILYLRDSMRGTPLHNRVIDSPSDFKKDFEERAGQVFQEMFSGRKVENPVLH